MARMVHVFGAVGVSVLLFILLVQKLEYHVKEEARIRTGLDGKVLSTAGDEVDSCRLRTLEVLTEKSERTNGSLAAARKCWERALVFYVSYPLDSQVGSHTLPLLASLWASQGDILELGSGWYSTPMAHRISVVHNRNLHTVDSKYGWLKFFLFFASDRHRLSLVRSKKNTGLDGNSAVESKTFDDNHIDVDKAVETVDYWEDVGGRQHWGLIFIDQAPYPQRRADLVRLRSNGDLLLVHDTEPNHDRHYRLQEPLSSFKHRLTFGPEWSGPHTDVVSDTRPDLVSAVGTLCKWGTEILKDIR